VPPLKVLFAVQDWGLGHATRDLVLIRGLLRHGHRVMILATGRALALLRDELGEACAYVELRDIPKPLGRRAFSFYVRMSLSMPEVFWIYHQEQRLARRLTREYGIDRIVSDSWYGDLQYLGILSSVDR
jgi:UDP:flavonoid glycosyltransferase YjiC (YdhE family)